MFGVSFCLKCSHVELSARVGARKRSHLAVDLVDKVDVCDSESISFRLDLNSHLCIHVAALVDRSIQERDNVVGRDAHARVYATLHDVRRRVMRLLILCVKVLNGLQKHMLDRSRQVLNRVARVFEHFSGDELQVAR